MFVYVYVFVFVFLFGFVDMCVLVSVSAECVSLLVSIPSLSYNLISFYVREAHSDLKEVLRSFKINTGCMNQFPQGELFHSQQRFLAHEHEAVQAIN